MKHIKGEYFILCNFQIRLKNKNLSLEHKIEMFMLGNLVTNALKHLVIAVRENVAEGLPVMSIHSVSLCACVLMHPSRDAVRGVYTAINLPPPT
jgi:hypothetical protein